MAIVCSVIVNFCLLFSILTNLTAANELPKNNAYHTYETDGLPIDNSIINFRAKRQVDTQIAPVVNINNAPTPGPVVTVATKLSPKDVVNTPLLGVNGTGQRKDYSIQKPTLSTEIKSNDSQQSTSESTVTSVGKANLGKTLDKTYMTASPATAGISELTDDDDLVDKADIPMDTFNATINATLAKEGFKYKDDYFQYYNASQVYNTSYAQDLYNSFQNFTVSSLLSKSHRRAITVMLSFDFPFYGQSIQNVTVASGGFLYTGEYVHSWLAATQYIAPLMANFDTSISNDSVVRYKDNGTAFTVVWEKVPLQDRPNDGLFTFSVTLYNTGDITFAYHALPIAINRILDDYHPVKIGLSDAYIIDKTIYFARRKTIYEYHRVNFELNAISNNSIIFLKALPTCIQYTDCQNCVTNTSHTFQCSWCPQLNRCSTGTDRKRQEWIQKGCDRNLIALSDQCPARGSKGNNYDEQQSVPASPSLDNKWIHQDPNTNVHGTDSKEPEVTIKNAQPLADAISPSMHSGGVNYAIGFLMPCVVVMCLVLWVFYAYRNPHTKSGQLLIQYRPSQWSWRRGEARYTAATIHM